MTRYDFLVDTYRTERLKTLSVWAQVPDDRMRARAEHRARTPLEHMVHQCLSEDGWMRSMLGIDIARDALPADEARDAFISHYGSSGQARRICGDVVRRGDSVLRGASHAGLGPDPTLSALCPPSRAVERGNPCVGAAAVFDIWAHGRHRRSSEERRTHHLSWRNSRSCGCAHRTARAAWQRAVARHRAAGRRRTIESHRTRCVTSATFSRTTGNGPRR